MEPTRELIDALFRGRVERTRRVPPGDKLLSGPILFDEVCRRMMDGIRHQFPGADDKRVKQILLERLNVARLLESRPMKVANDE